MTRAIVLADSVLDALCDVFENVFGLTRIDARNILADPKLKSILVDCVYGALACGSNEDIKTKFKMPAHTLLRTRINTALVSTISECMPISSAKRVVYNKYLQAVIAHATFVGKAEQKCSKAHC